MSEPNELEDRLAATLRAKAAQVRVDDGPFVPSALGEVVPLDQHRRRRGRAAWMIAAAVAAVVALIVGITLVRADHRQATVSQGDHPDRPGVLAPTWVPDGYQLWDVSPSSGPGSLVPASGPITIQLFADDRGPVLDLQVGVAGALPTGSWSGDPLTVRGQSATVVMSSTGPAGNQGFAERATIRWTEGGQPIKVVADRTTKERVVALLDGLVWQVPGDPLSGADAASLPSLHQVGGVDRVSLPASAGATFVYAKGAPTVAGTPEIVVRVAGPGANLTNFQENQIGSAPLQPDGTLETTGVISRADAKVASVLWPDGRGATAMGAGVDAADLVRLIRSLAPTDDADLDARRAEITARVLALPVVATAEIAPLTLEVHGEGGTALCAHAGSGPVSCGAVAGSGSAWSGEIGLAVSIVVDGDWYVGAGGTLPFAATPVAHEYYDPATTPSTGPGVTTLADLPVIHTADQAPWHFLVAAMPPKLTDAAVDWDTTNTSSCSQHDGGSCASGFVLTRPPS